MLHQKTMGYYTPTRVDFTKTYHSSPKIHGLSIESMDFGGSLHRVLMESMETPQGLYEDFLEIMRTPRGLHEDSMRTPWKAVGDCQIQVETEKGDLDFTE